MIFDVRILSFWRPAALIRVTGEDAFAFLQGQFSNELRQGTGAVTYGLWLNQKGKVVADSYVLRLGEQEFLIMSPHSPAEVIKKRLEDYIVADDVVLADETELTHGLAFWGAKAGALVTALLGEAPPAGRFGLRDDVLAFSARWLPGENYVLLGSASRIATLLSQALGHGWQEASPSEVEFVRISAGIPRIPVDVGPGDLPNEANLEDSAISYTKGCYLGQEVMARLKNLGQVRRRLQVVRGRGTPPAPLASLYQAEKKVGDIRSVAARDDEFVAFAMLSLINLNPGAGLSLEPLGTPTITLDRHG